MVHPPELIQPLCRIGFTVDEHYMDHWLYGILPLALDLPTCACIREADASDFGRLTEISAACEAKGWHEQPEEWFSYWRSQDHSAIFVTEVEGQTIGYECLDLYGFESEKGTVVWIQTLAVVPDHQRRGHGRSLLLNGLRWGQRQGAQRSFLATDKRNHVARRLYESVGYRPSGAEEVNLVLGRD